MEAESSGLSKRWLDDAQRPFEDVKGLFEKVKAEEYSAGELVGFLNR